MATTSISALTETTTINSTTVGPFDYSGATYKVTMTTLGAFINTNAVTVSATGNITGANLNAAGLSLSGNVLSTLTTAFPISSNTSITTTGNANGGNLNATITANAASFTGGVVSVTGNITSGNLTTAGILTVNSGAAATGIVNGAANAVGNIGSSVKYFNQLFAQATTALYADLAEVYEADQDYAPGTVVSFGGDKEVTVSTSAGDSTVAGVISANPSYLMNNGLTADHRAIVALTGRVPTSVTGTVTKGAMMISAGKGRACACATPAMGTVIGKALENFSGESGIIEIVVGRM